MIWKTHLAIGIAVGFYFSQYMPNPLLFIPISIIASILPDIDSGFSYLGRKPIFRPVQWVTRHRGIFHSYTFCILLSLIISFFYPFLAFPFFIGYSFHLVADSFTIQGIKAFWPIKYISKGLIRTGGKIDKVLFFTFVIIDIILVGTFVYAFF